MSILFKNVVHCYEKFLQRRRHQTKYLRYINTPIVNRYTTNCFDSVIPCPLPLEKICVVSINFRVHIRIYFHRSDIQMLRSLDHTLSQRRPSSKNPSICCQNVLYCCVMGNRWATWMILHTPPFQIGKSL